MNIEGHVVAKNTTFVRGNAHQAGAIYTWMWGTMVVQNCSFINNTAIGASHNTGGAGLLGIFSLFSFPLSSQAPLPISANRALCLTALPVLRLAQSWGSAVLIGDIDISTLHSPLAAFSLLFRFIWVLRCDIHRQRVCNH